MDSIANMILTILSLLVILIFIGSIYAFFYAIITFIFSAGDPDKIKKAWNSIRYMILGIVMTLTVLFLFPLILKKVKIPGYEYYTANNIFSQVSAITWGLLNLWKEAADQYQQWTINPGGAVSNPWANNENNPTDTPLPTDDDYAELEL